MVLRPSRDALDPGTQQRMTVAVGGHAIEYFSHRFGVEKDKHDLVVVKFPGTSGRAERSSVFPGNLLRGTSAGDVSGLVLTWNPPGYGGSGGRPSLSGMPAAATSFFDAVLNRHAADATLWLCGNSLGCNPALHLAANDRKQRIAGLILRNPPPLIPVVKRIAKKYPMGKYIDPIVDSLIDEMNAEFTAPLAKTPAVFLKSMSDTLVPPKLQDRLISGYGGPNQVVSMEGLEHDGVPTDDHERLISQSLVWLWEQRLISQPLSTS
ncbi:Alpha/beta hydrolase family protein [Rubripirellula obstinata]|uniref:Alpha/beta hydrolase family protein n=2 Tax=Rubripirellula obstinata TaxID=406547 RepID=A0A5B1CHH8_9BACT|nr:Alpha/beta hydrolase family protein [Rubripirellula obstinata]